MRFPRDSQHMHSLVEVMLPLFAATARAQGDTSSSHAVHDATTILPTCESRTVNYITHTLPQQCLTSTPLTTITTTPTAVESISITISPTAESAGQRNESDGGSKKQENDLDGDGNDLSTGGFMSFEEWKAMMLKKSGQDPLEARSRKSHDREAYSEGDFDTLGEEGEISLDFDAYSDRISEITSATKYKQQKEDSVEKVSYDEGLAPTYRSKDAGKTCKERFSYASFDAGANVLKTSPGAKNPKAILTEYKDSYMLLECAMKNKFFIVELSDDILVDTVVIANFEFFSSMVRQFRVSVSDRYPVKLEKWKVLGEFTARNSRDIQPFLVENPQIWARYLRVEILSHYGNEYYCPISLLRVHGTRMLDSMREVDPSDVEGEAPVEEESIKAPLVEEGEEVVEAAGDPVEEIEVQEPLPFVVENQTVTMEQSDLVAYWDKSYFLYRFEVDSTCGTEESPVQPSHTLSDEWVDDNAAPARPQPVGTAQQTSQATSSGSPSQDTVQSEAESSQSTQAVSTTVSGKVSSASYAAHSSEATPASTSIPPTEQTNVQQSPNSTTKRSSSVHKNKTAAPTSLKPPTSKTSQQPKPSSSSSTSSRNKTSTSTSTAAASSPTVQDSFFKQLTKRLQTLESNTTLSLQYIEMQSKFLQEALLKLERRQLQKVDLFLDTLNKTVLSELRDVRSQYDQIWQSTVIALETQREQSEREIVALSSRLGVLADEVVFQKRMAIVQSVLLLGCLILVIFSKGLASASGLELYYPSQFLAGVGSGSGSRVNSPVYGPATPSPPRERERERDKGLIKRAKRSNASLRDSIEESIEEVEEETESPRPPFIKGPRSNKRPQQNPIPEAPVLSQQNNTKTHVPESRPRPSSVPRAISEETGLDFYQPPTPASMDIGYDSEPANAPGGGDDYFSSPGGKPRAAEESTHADKPGDMMPTNKKKAAERQLTPGSEGDAMEYSDLTHRAAATGSRPPISHSGSMTGNAANTLPVLPEDPD